MSSIKQHATWLSLLEISGPFLSINTLNRVLPNGVDRSETEPADVAELKAAYAEWQEERRDPAIHREWIRYVLKTVLKWEERVLAEGQAIPEPIQYTAIEHGSETIRPDYILHERNKPNAIRALVLVYPPEQALERAVPKQAWSASPATRMLSLLHATGVRLGLVTNGEQWMLVNAPKEGLSGYISWYAELWGEDRETYRAFVSLLDLHRFFGVADEDTLPAMLDESANDAQEVTDQLGAQVRRAVEILVRAFDKLDQDNAGRLLEGVSESKLYEASLTVMMRLVFLLSAEERGLFLLGDPLYDQNYAVSTLRAQLHEAADHSGEQVLERRSDAWSRLLATFRLVYSGSAHEDLQLPAYGGSLFDPDRFPFLEGRTLGTPPAINNRTVLHLLDALQILQLKGEARRLSFRALDIEQIGHVYEGLLDHEARRADEVILGFDGKYEPEIALSELEAQTNLEKFLKDATGRGENAIKNKLKEATDGERLRRLVVACGDDNLFWRIKPYLNLLRDDELEQPVVILPDSVYVTAGTERRATGTHYTPKTLTEPIVQHTLEPLVYFGVAEGAAREDWQLRNPTEILELKVCDMAMGSGAFLVQACRYLGTCLVEAWEALQQGKAGNDVPRLTIFGTIPTNALGEMLIPDDPQERLTLALRLVADRCLYGVDKNQLAVEMGKLSLWLTTLAKGRPFTFLDHALKHGDSLVGVSLNQLANWNLDAGDSPVVVPLLATRIRNQIAEIVELRQNLESFTVNTVEDQQEKARLLFEAEAKTHDLRDAANLLLASYMNDYSKSEQNAMRQHLLEVVQRGVDVPEGYYTPVENTFNLPPFHWELEFPEVFLRERKEGFDAFVGNPPFQSGKGGEKSIAATMGDTYVSMLETLYIRNKRSADLSAYFFWQARIMTHYQGFYGLVVTNTISEGTTKQVALDPLLRNSGSIFLAIENMIWPGTAAVVVSVIHGYKQIWKGAYILNGSLVQWITSRLDGVRDIGEPKILAEHPIAFHGTKPRGDFTINDDEIPESTMEDYAHAPYYLSGQDINSSPDIMPSRRILYFPYDEEGQAFAANSNLFKILQEKVFDYRQSTGIEKLMKLWWRYEYEAEDLYEAIRSAVMPQIFAACRVSNKFMLARAMPNQIFSDGTVVFLLPMTGDFGVLQSSIYAVWVRKYCATFKEDIRFNIKDVVLNFPMPVNGSPISEISEIYHETRRQIMLSRQEGLTATYNRFHEPQETSPDIQELRELHRQMDEQVALVYGWSDLDLGHGFHETAQGIRYTISEAARREVLKRLLALNFERYEEEVKLGLHDKAKGKGKGRKKAAKDSDAGEKQESKQKKLF